MRNKFKNSINILKKMKPVENTLLKSDLIKSNFLPISKMLINEKNEIIIPKIVGDIRHYPPANKEWKNSTYAYNKNSLRSLPVLDKMASKTIKSYFNMSNNKKLARSFRMRNLIRRKTVKRLFVSRPEIKQSNDKVNITVYTFNREKQFFLRKMYFYDRNMYINKNIYLYKLWLKKNLLAFKKTFKDRKSLINNNLLKQNRKMKTLRKKINKTYIHNVLLKKREKKKRTSVSNLKMIFLKLVSKGSKEKKNSYHISNNYVKKAFNNYLVRKISKKIKFKMRNSYSIVKIRQNFRKPKRSRLKRFKRFKQLKKIRLPYYNFKFNNEIKFFSFKLVSELKYIRKLFQFYFIKYLLYFLKIELIPTKLVNFKFSLTSSNKNNKNKENKKNHNKKGKVRIIQFKNRYSYNKLKNIELLNLKLLHLLKTGFLKLTFSLKNKNLNNIKKKIRSYKIIFNKWKKRKNMQKFQKKLKIEIIKLNNSKQTFPYRQKMNKKNMIFLYNILNRQKVKNMKNRPKKFTIEKKTIDFLYKKFQDKYFLIFLSKFFKKEFLYINYYGKFLINQLKFGKFLPGLKLLISKIYSKKVELNLVNLKYPHLNSDIYADSIVTKLKRKIGLLKVIRRSLNLAKLPSEYLPYDKASDLNKLQSLSIHKSLDINTLSIWNQRQDQEKNKLKSYEDKLHTILTALYPYSLAHNFILEASKQTSIPANLIEDKKNLIIDVKNKIWKILNNIKYKWVSGVRLETAGRLTRRFTASKSVFKFRYKGSLRDVDYSQKTDISKRNSSTVMLRNQVKSNSQYSFAKGKRRIGAFGVKIWIASY